VFACLGLLTEESEEFDDTDDGVVNYVVLLTLAFTPVALNIFVLHMVTPRVFLEVFEPFIAHVTEKVFAVIDAGDHILYSL